MRLAVGRGEEALELRLVLDASDELALADEELALALLSLDTDVESEEELAVALDSDVEDAESLLLVAALAVGEATEAVLVAPWTWKPPLKLNSVGFASSMIWTKTWPAGTSGGTVKVTEPVLGIFWATTMPSVGRMLPLVWILMVTVLEEKEVMGVSEEMTD